MRRALLDTSVIVSLHKRDESAPDLSGFDELFVSSLSYSEIRMGLATVSGDLRQQRQDRLDEMTALFGPGIPYDDRAALEYGRIVRQSVASGKGARTHTMDRMIAGVSRAHGLALATRNAKDLSEVATLLDLVEV